MGNPFLQHVRDFFARISGRSLAVAGIVWIVLWAWVWRALGAINLPGRRGESAETASTAMPTSANPLLRAALRTPVRPSLLLHRRTGRAGSCCPPRHPRLRTRATFRFSRGRLWLRDRRPWHRDARLHDGPDKDQLGLSWVKQQVRWDHFSASPGQMDWSGYDAMVLFANERGLKVMMSVVGSPAWSRTYFDTNPEAARQMTCRCMSASWASWSTGTRARSTLSKCGMNRTLTASGIPKKVEG